MATNGQNCTPQQVHGNPTGHRVDPLLSSLFPSSLQSDMITGNYLPTGYPPGLPQLGMMNRPTAQFPGMMPTTNPASGHVQSEAPQGTQPPVQSLEAQGLNGPTTKSVSGPTQAPLGNIPNVQSQAPSVFRPAPQYPQMMGPGIWAPTFNGPTVQSQAPPVNRAAPQYPSMLGQGMYGPPFPSLIGSGTRSCHSATHGLPRGYPMTPYSYMPNNGVYGAQKNTTSHRCRIKKVMVFAPKNAPNFHYNSKTGKIVRHKCDHCERRVYERDLCELYSKWYEPISNYVLFVENHVTNMIEQYVFSPKTGGLEQVNYPELKYDSSEIDESDRITIYENGDEKVVAMDVNSNYFSSCGLRKQHFKYGQWISIPAVPVKTLLMKEMEDKVDEKKSEKEKDVERNVEDENEYSEYIKTLPKFKIKYCKSMQNDIVFILSPNNGSYLKFVFNKTKQEYETHNCTKCEDFITEDHLIPKYSVYSNTVKTYVFHCKNTETSRMEQYIYDEKTQGFEQVYLPELKYEASMDTRSNTLLVLTGNNCGATSIMRDTNTGKFIKEQFCLKTNQFAQLPKVPVRTFSVKIMESENQKKKLQKTDELKIQETSVTDSDKLKIQNKQDSEEPKIQETSVKNSEESPEDVENLIREMNECMKQFSLLNDKMTIALKKEEQMKQLTVTIDENQDPLLNSQDQPEQRLNAQDPPATHFGESSSNK